MARSFQMGAANRSFDTNNTSFTTVFSEATQPDTANTSFAQSFAQPNAANTSFTTECDGGGEDVKGGDVVYPEVGDVVYPDLSRSSSSAIVSIEDEELVEAEAAFGFDGLTHSVSRSRNAHSSSRQPVAAARHVEQSPSSSPPSQSDVLAEVSPNVQQPVNDSTVPKMHYQLRELPTQGLFMEDLPRSMRKAPFIVRMECALIAATNNLPPSEVMDRYTKAVSTYEGFWEAIGNHPKFLDKSLNTKRRSSSKAWAAAKDRFLGWTFKGSLKFNARSTGQAFTLQLEPLQWDNSCRLQRKFGSDRFLYLTVPAFDYSAIPQKFRSEDALIDKQWDLWLTKEHSFLGRKWRAFHLEDVKKKKSVRNSRQEDGAKKRVVLFATEGCDIAPITVGEMLNWFFPFAHNTEQSFCKAFARLDLALSRTTPTVSLKPSQVHYVLDTVAEGSLEDARFNDRTLDWSERYPEDVVMNDGCSIISVGAAKLIWKALKQPGSIPSAFQGRFGGAKGMWMVSAAINTDNLFHQDVWINITESQLKFNPHLVDKDPRDKGYDPHRLTFEVNGYCTYPTPSNLHMAFIPILVDRGVSVEAMASLMDDRLSFEREELIETLADPTRIRSWVNKQTMRKEETFRDTESPARGWLAGLPQPTGEKIILLLESGFLPSTSQGLSDFFWHFVEGQYAWMERTLSVPLGRATNLYGLADPAGVLKPGEIHVQFSTNFIDELSGESYFSLNELDLLVARQPACRRSDVQKVRAVFKHELAYLTDVVVFPSKGQYPLAGKLQGGDYDGDRFWLCWEPALVEPFRNAPAPLHSPKPASYGIEVERRKLRQIMDVNDLNTVGAWLSESFKFRNNPTLLGIVTNFLESQIYYQGTLHSPGIEALCAMHDLLVDSAKQGFVFSRKDFERFVENRNDLHPRPPKPAFKEAMEKSTKRRPKRGNPLDHLYFNVLRPHNQKTLEILKAELAKEDAERMPDPVLRERYVTERDDDDRDPQLLRELDRLMQKLEGPCNFWNSRFAGGAKELNFDYFDETTEKSYEKYRAILPSEAGATHPVIKRWLRREHGRFTGWDLLRASALAYKYPNKDKFNLYMAGAEFTYLKSGEDPYARTATWRMYATLKPRKPPKIRNVDGASDEDDGYETAPENSS
jgi:hypothetical protein